MTLVFNKLEMIVESCSATVVAIGSKVGFQTDKAKAIKKNKQVCMKKNNNLTVND